MKYCEAVNIELDDGHAVFRGNAWPQEITVLRELIEYPQGPHIQFGRKGTLQFLCANGQASYRRIEDVLGGWRYVLTQGVLPNAVRPTVDSKREPKPAPVAVMRLPSGVEAFQWLPHAIPPMSLPEWFIRADFEQNKDGKLLIRALGQVVRAEPSDWIIAHANGKISAMTATQFASQQAAAAA